MGRKKLGKKRVKKRYPRMFIMLSAALVAAVALGVAYYLIAVSSYQSMPAILRAAIIDGLSEDFPNPRFIEEAKNLLESAGYDVTIFNGSEVNVELFRRLPTMNFTLIIMRLHGGRIQQPIGLFIGSGIFAEPFREDKYEYEFRSGYFLKGVAYAGGREYFVITPHYVLEKFEGRFPGSIVIVLSCYSMWDQVLASAFIERGASAFIGIDQKADISYLDRAGLELVRYISQGAGAEEAVLRVMEEVGPDPITGARILHYAGR
ncbi:MAG: hypothetical protein QXG25_03985 [Nitrososphaerota archaeon]